MTIDFDDAVEMYFDLKREQDERLQKRYRSEVSPHVRSPPHYEKWVKFQIFTGSAVDYKDPRRVQHVIMGPPSSSSANLLMLAEQAAVHQFQTLGMKKFNLV